MLRTFQMMIAGGAVLLLGADPAQAQSSHQQFLAGLNATLAPVHQAMREMRQMVYAGLPPHQQAFVHACISRGHDAQACVLQARRHQLADNYQQTQAELQVMGFRCQRGDQGACARVREIQENRHRTYMGWANAQIQGMDAQQRLRDSMQAHENRMSAREEARNHRDRAWRHEDAASRAEAQGNWRLAEQHRQVAAREHANAQRVDPDRRR